MTQLGHFLLLQVNHITSWQRYTRQLNAELCLKVLV
jgi:hypothetical protein